MTEPKIAILCSDFDAVYLVSAYLNFLHIVHYASIPNETGEFTIENPSESKEAPKCVVTTIQRAEGHPYTKIGRFIYDPPNAYSANRISTPNYAELFDLIQVYDFLVTPKRVKKMKTDAKSQ